MRQGRVLAGVALAVALVFPLAGCATGKVRMSMQKSCQAHGGTWSQAQETCTPAPGQAARQAKAICADQGGEYIPGGTCELPGL